MKLTSKELERYKRQMMLDGFGLEAQERLKGSTVLVAGVGGLGGTAAFYLAAAGIGRLLLIHPGNLTLSNLNRQLLMTADWIGMPRVIKARETLRNLNPGVEVRIFDEPIELERLQAVLPEVDIVLDCRHNFPERRLLNRACVEVGVPMVEAAMNGMDGYLFNVIPGITPCLHCLYPEDPDWDPYGFPVLGAVPGALGSLAATEAIKLLTGFKEPLLNRLLYFDLGGMSFKKFKICQRADCGICATLQETCHRQEKEGAYHEGVNRQHLAGRRANGRGVFYPGAKSGLCPPPGSNRS